MDRWIRVGAALAIATALMVAGVVYRDTLSFVGTTYPGFGVFPSGTIALQPLTPRPRFLAEHGLRPRDRISHVDGAATADGAAVMAALRPRSPGEPIVYRADRPRGGRLERTVPAQTFTSGDFRQLVLPLLAGGLLVLLSGAIGVLMRPDLAATRILFLFCWSSALNLLLLGPDYALHHRFVPWSSAIGSALSKATLLHLALTFPSAVGRFGGFPRRAILGAIYGLMGLQGAGYAYAIGREPAWIRLFDELAFATFIAGFLGCFANVMYTAARAPSAKLRQQARVARIGPALCLLFVAAVALAAWIRPGLRAPVLGTVVLCCVFAISLTYAMLRHNLFEFDAVLRRGLAASIVLGAGALLYLGLFMWLRTVLGESAAWVSTTLTLGLVTLGIPTFGPLRARAESLVTEVLFPGVLEARARVAESGPRLAAVRDEAGAAAVLHDLVTDGLHARTVRVLRVDSKGRWIDLLTPDQLVGEGAFLETCGNGEAFDLDGAGAAPPPAIRAGMQALGARVLAPFPAAEEGGPAPGALACGSRDDGRLYTSEDILQLEAIAAHAAVAFSNASAWQHVRELQERLAQDNTWLRHEIEVDHGFEEVVGVAPGLKRALAQVEQVAPTDATVLVTGETGTGKELLVRALHTLSPRRERPLVKMACAAIPETLFESELFGHEKGAFTGASRSKMGRFEAADGGTLFFDDVDTLPLSIQAKLLRALQEGEVQRLGTSEVSRVDVRVISATNRDLLDEVRAGRFREDLYYRLHVVPIEIPPLRERREDILPLSHHFVELESRKLDREPRPLSAATTAALAGYDWPGNVRELRNVIERAVVLWQGGEIELPEPLVDLGIAPGEQRPRDDRPLAEQVRDFKRQLIDSALEASGGNQRAAAERLGLHRQSLTRMIRDLDGRSTG